MPRKAELTGTGEVSLPLHGMNIFLAPMLRQDGKRSLKMSVEGVGAVVHITENSTGTWTISVRGGSGNAVGATKRNAVSICVGRAPSVTLNGITDSQNLEE